jgi:Spy/CpxP family protein refolding chaperone
MVQAKSWLVGTLSLLLIGSVTYSAFAQQNVRRMRGFGRTGMLGVLMMEQVQDEIKLTDDQKAKVRETSEKIMEGMSDKMSALREVEDGAERMKKMEELSKEIDRQAYEQLQGVIERDQAMRFYQVYMQIRPALDVLSHRMIVERLGVTPEQQEKLAAVKKESEQKAAELMEQMRDMDREQRGEMMQKFRQQRTETNEKAIAVLTEEQQKQFEEMKGEKFELQWRRRPQ